MLKDQYTNIEGFQNTTLGAYSPPKFDAMKLNNHAVQILNIKNMHWVCIKLEKTDPNTVRVTIADGMGYPITETISQVSSMLRGTNINQIEVIRLYPQKQNNGYDCGPMAIAFAYMFCSGIDPNENIFDPDMIRNQITKIAMGKAKFGDIQFVDKISIIEPKNDIAQICFCKCRSSKKEGLKLCYECLEHFHVSCLLVFDDKCTTCRENEIPVEEISELDSQSISSNDNNIENLDNKIEELENKTVEYYTTKYGKTGVFYDGYAYYLKRQNKFSDVYICRHRNCQSILKVCEGAVVENEDLHDHEMDLVYAEIRKTMNEMKTRAKETLDPIPSIYTECLSDLHSRDEIAASEFPPFEYFI